MLEAQFDAVPVGLDIVCMHAIAKVDGVGEREMACDVWEGGGCFAGGVLAIRLNVSRCLAARALV